MLDVNWLTQEAQNLHGSFVSFFYLLITCLLALGVIIEYFKFPIGQLPSFGVLVGRVFIAVVLLISFNEVANTLSAFADALSSDLGNLDKLDGVLKKMGEKVDSYSLDWLNARSLIITGLSILTYTFLFYSVLIAEVAHLFTWTLLYVFSPLLIALYVLPVTAGATKALYRSLIEVASWKIVFSVLSSLLWASVLVEMNSGGATDFMKMICINLMLGGSLIATPWIVHALAGAGLAGFTRNFSGVSSAIGFLTPPGVYHNARRFTGGAQKVYRVGGQVVSRSASIGKHAANFSMDPISKTRSSLQTIRSKVNNTVPFKNLFKPITAAKKTDREITSKSGKKIEDQKNASRRSINKTQQPRKDKISNKGKIPATNNSKKESKE